MFLWYGVGFFFFISRYPESHYPGNYWTTYVLPSHTIWHFCVLAAVYTWYFYQSLFQELMTEHGCKPYNTASSSSNAY